MAIKQITVEFDTDFISAEELENSIQLLLEKSVIEKLQKSAFDDKNTKDTSE